MPYFRKRPVVVQAVQFTGANIDEIWEAFGAGRIYGYGEDNDDDVFKCLLIQTLEGEMRALPGWWIVRGVQGELYPVDPDIFAQTFEPASSTPLLGGGPGTVGVDFDGVVHTYEHGWADGTIYGDLMPGARKGLIELMERYAVFIFTSREVGPVAEWLSDHGFTCRTGHGGPFWSERGVLLVTQRKFPAVAYVDDRALPFTGWAALRALLT